MKHPKKLIKVSSLSLFLIFAPMQQCYANTNQAGWWVGAGFCSLLYTPLKTAFALLMGVTGGLTMMATVPSGDTNVSTQIVKWGMYGDWLIRPDHLLGYSPVKFVGTNNAMRFVQLQPKKLKHTATVVNNIDEV